MNCPPSAQLEQQFPNETNTFAEEGTAAHDLAEHKLKKALKMRSKKPTSLYHSDEMDEMTDLYVEYCLELIEKSKENCSDLQILIEQKLDFSDYVPEGFGTGDLVVVGKWDPPCGGFKIRTWCHRFSRKEPTDDALCTWSLIPFRHALRH